ncbi:peptidase C15, pyroglutamyl peptidase I-like protein [Amniculicola lignicola CBS 123094]|uniref:Peptidase C15, pyroglutamyl peptidase I-like protein n=1 Tax=Amniculicola lignicola CBS 123094 TaxID=1392246 RepID=A0A6A5VX63_9PLEO|nr:peptidase C15, pyroglutamyl peptidase I-like protein [Amniculicola lignicola CBS 123094]
MPRAWSTAARQPPSEKREEPVTILVTGFGPFLEKYPRNTSWEIASTLPALLPASQDNPTPIHIRVHHAPVRVAYDNVLELVPSLLPPTNKLYPTPSIILHIGLAAGRTFYTLENGAHGRGYGAIPDVDGGRFTDKAAEEHFPPSEFPTALQTSFQSEDVLERWRTNLGYGTPHSDDLKELKPDVRISQDAGNFMCGFIYWNSLAHYFSLKQDERPVMFLHVPDLTTEDGGKSVEEKLKVGREVAIALIKALVESKRTKGIIDAAGRSRVMTEEEEVGKERAAAGTDVNFA